MLREGTFLQDRYEVLEQIGSGGMSVVYKAKCHKLNRLVAIKVLKNEFSQDANFVSKFKMEAQAAAGLSHPNIVNVFDVVDEGELHYIVMELIEGVTLKSYINKKGYLEVKETIGIAIQVAQGIAAAHEQRIIHRDIKPQNMIISKDGKVKVADFGIARAVSAQTLNSNAMGSVHYISPEQARGGYSDARSDIYSLGITMYEMVTGHVPFEGDNTVTVALAHLEERVTPPSVYNPNIPVSLERIILQCTEKKPESRYASVNSVIGDLRKALLNPDEDLSREEPAGARRMGETVTLSNEEMARIKEHKRPVERINLPARVSEPRSISGAGDEKASSHIEKILTAGGIVVAILIVAVLLFVFSRLGGLFSGGTDITIPTLASENSGSEGTIDDTQVLMPDVVELSEDMAEAKLKDSHLSMKRSYEYSDTIEAGYVISQNPEEGEVIAKWSNVAVVISNGSDKIDLAPFNLTQLEGTAAEGLLTARQLLVNKVTEESDKVEKGKVIRYEPERVAQGGTVTLYISTGPHIEMVAVPGMIGLSESDAIARLVEAGLNPGTATTAHSEVMEAGHVISQSEVPDSSVAAGSAVDYVVSLGPEEVTVSKKRYVASINTTYDFSSLIGPGSSSANITLMIRLHQIVNGENVYKVLMEPRSMSGNTLLPIQYNSIVGEPGVDSGILEVVEVDSQAVIKSYPLTFFPMD